MDTEPSINWPLLLRTVDHFKQLGYVYVEVPWTVSEQAQRATYDGDIHPVFQQKYVVASGEQSFVQMQLDGILMPGKYVTLTPCFRDESTISSISRSSFMKVELYITDIAETSHDEMISHCVGWFNTLQNMPVALVETEEGIDIELNGIEIGSYGKRTYQGTTWLYGTALAEPRFSTIINRNQFAYKS